MDLGPRFSDYRSYAGMGDVDAGPALELTSGSARSVETHRPRFRDPHGTGLGMDLGKTIFPYKQRGFGVPCGSRTQGVPTPPELRTGNGETWRVPRALLSFNARSNTHIHRSTLVF